MDNIGIYCIYFDQHPNEYYIGCSSNIATRKQEHFSALRRGSHVNIKLQNYFNKYGIPNFEVLIYCDIADLKDQEEYYIVEFDSYKNGLNLTNGRENGGYGEGNNAAKHTEEQYVSVLMHLANTDLSCAAISELTGVSRSIVKSISGCRSHGYLQEKYPEEYKKVLSKKYTRDNSAASKGIQYPNLISPSGEIYTVDNIHKFCQEHDGLQPQNLHKVLTKQRNSHKGWKLA